MYKKYAKTVLYVVLLFAVSISVSGCSLKQKTGTTAPKVFTIWSFEDEDIWKPVETGLAKQLGGYEIKYVKKKFNDTYENDALNSILSGQGPDIWAVPNDWIYRHKEKLAPMPSDLAKTINIDDKFVPAIKQACLTDGQIYALSPFTDSLMVYYNEDMFSNALDEYTATHKSPREGTDAEVEAFRTETKRIQGLLAFPPLKWHDFEETVRLITKKDGATITRSGVAMGTSNNIAKNTDIVYSLMLQNGTPMTSSDLKLATFSLPQSTNTNQPDAPAKRAIDFYTSFSNPTSPNYSWNSSMPSDVESFAQGKTAMIFANSSLANYYAQAYPNFKYSKAPLPQIGDNNTNVTDYASFYAFTAPKNTANTQIAWNTIMSISADEYGFASTLKIPSSKKDTRADTALTSRVGDTNPGKTQSQTAQLWIKGRYPKEIDSIFRNIIDKVNADPNSAQAQLDTAAIAATNLLKKTDW